MTTALLAFEPATAADVPALVGMIGALYAHEGIPVDAERSRSAIAPLLAEPGPGRLWLLRWEGRVVGYMALIWSYYLEFGPTAILDELYLEPGVRGRGLGGRAIAFALDESRRRGMVAIRLEVERDNPARLLYERAGFVAHQRDLMTCDLMTYALGDRPM